MGCVVNGPGSQKQPILGYHFQELFEEPKAPVYIDGGHYTTLKEIILEKEFPGNF